MVSKFYFAKHFLIYRVSGLRVEFCKAYARVRRWREQVRLVRAEMGYCLASLEHRAKTWEQWATVPQFSGEHAEGAIAYAHKQAAVCRIISGNFRVIWARYLIGSSLESMVNIGSSPVQGTSTDTPRGDGDESNDELGGSELEEDDQEPEGVDDDDWDDVM